MRLVKNILIAFASSAILLMAPNQAISQQKELLYGEWVFEKYEAKDGSIYNENDNANKGLTLVFLANGKFKSSHPGGREQNNFEGIYRYYPDKKNLVLEHPLEGTDKLRVALINKTTLKLFYDDDHPFMVFKKK